jgi:hypothetical protein
MRGMLWLQLACFGLVRQKWTCRRSSLKQCLNLNYRVTPDCCHISACNSAVIGLLYFCGSRPLPLQQNCVSTLSLRHAVSLPPLPVPTMYPYALRTSKPSARIIMLRTKLQYNFQGCLHIIVPVVLYGCETWSVT